MLKCLIQGTKSFQYNIGYFIFRHGNVEDNAYSQVKHGYAGTGLRTNGTGAVALQQRAAADGRDAASHQQEATASPTYAEVDKSKKKKKEEKLDYTYAEVDKSKKSKKVCYSKDLIILNVFCHFRIRNSREEQIKRTLKSAVMQK